ncbi:MAG: glycosyltransferase family 4 protein [Ekhidna sp.]
MNFSLQLKARGWSPIILTPENPQFQIKDERLSEKVKDIEVIRLPIWEPFDVFHKLTGNKDRKNVQQGLVLEKEKRSFMDKFFVWVRGNLFIPDPRVFWVKKASSVAIDLVKSKEIGAVVTTGPPHSMHLIGRRVKRKTGVRWIADFRDPWSKWDVLDKLNTSALMMALHRKLERSVLEEADKVITVSNRLAQAFGEAEVLNNGITIPVLSSDATDDTYFTIGYFGMLNELRNPSQLWLVLDQLCREIPAFANRLRIRIGGIVAESIKHEILKLDELKNRVSFLGYLPHEEVQKEYTKCDILLLLLNKSDNSGWILPVKFFEYLAAKRMILCLGQRSSDLGDIMNGKGIGEILAYTDVNEIRAFVEDAFEHNRKPDTKTIRELISRFSHEALVLQLEKLLEQPNEY